MLGHPVNATAESMQPSTGGEMCHEDSPGYDARICNSPHVEYPLKLGRDAVLVADPLKDPLLLSVPDVVALTPLALELAVTDDEVASLVEDWAATKENALDTASSSDSGRVISMMQVHRTLVKQVRQLL